MKGVNIMEKNDISFSIDKTKFNFRVACIIEKDGVVLLHKKKQDDFWNLLGGRLKCMETCEEAIKRELKEELGATCDNVKLISVCENYFEFGGSDFHEMLVLYKVQLTAGIGNENIEDKIEIKWFNKDELDNIEIKPEFVKKLLLNGEDNFEWIVNNEIDNENK